MIYNYGMGPVWANMNKYATDLMITVTNNNYDR